MSTGIEIKLSSLQQADVNIDLAWPTGMMVQSQAAVDKDKFQLLQQFEVFGDSLKDIKDHKSFDFDEMEVNTSKPTPLQGIASYGMSLFWSQRLKTSRQGAKYNIKIATLPDKSIAVYSLKNISAPNIDIDNAILSDDFIQISTMLMNNIVDDVYAKSGIRVYSPLARVAITDNNCDKLAKIYNTSVPVMIRMLNINSVKKAHQCYKYTSFYEPNFAAAFVIRSAMSQRADKLTISIAEKQLSKIDNADVENRMSVDKITNILSHFNGPSGSSYDLQMIYNSARARSIDVGLINQPSKSVTPLNLFSKSTGISSQKDQKKVKDTKE